LKSLGKLSPFEEKSHGISWGVHWGFHGIIVNYTWEIIKDNETSWLIIMLNNG
jgi:hypothetical protein